VYEAKSVEGSVGCGAQMDGKDCEGGTIENDKNKIKSGFHNSVCEEKEKLVSILGLRERTSKWKRVLRGR
jgi:hypothetical protein